MKLNVALTYLLYFGMAVMLYPVKYTANPLLNVGSEKKKLIECKTAAMAKAEVLHSDLLFKY